MDTHLRTRAAFAIGCLSIGALAQPSYPIVSSGQTTTYDNVGAIAPPKPGQPFYGQDAQHPTRPASYTLSADGLTVRDNVTGLTWQRSPDTDGDSALLAKDKLTWAQAQALPAKLNAAKFGGFDDWRLPSIKELFSLFDARGTDPIVSDVNASAALKPFIDTRYFKFAYGDTAAGERIVDSQYASSTLYVNTRTENLLFGVNFADGRIKGYGLKLRGRDKTFFVQLVRGNPAYGKNDFQDNGNGTVTDRATGLMWAQADSGNGMDWQAALAWVQARNAAKHLGYSDWRLPNVKELQSLVDYSRSPDTSQSAAIAAVFRSTPITNEAKQPDYPFYWSSTTHAGVKDGEAAMYVAFGRAAGWMSARESAAPPAGVSSRSAEGPPPSAEAADGKAPNAVTSDQTFMDVHGAGAQRSDPKTGDASRFPRGRGPQGDVIRINNFVRLLRG